MSDFQHLTEDCGHHCIFMLTPTAQEKQNNGIEQHCSCTECHGAE